MNQSLTPQTALIYVMVIMSAADRRMTDKEFRTIGQIVQSVPVFASFDPECLVAVAEESAGLLAQDDGLDTVLDLVHRALPPELRETAYALAVEVAAADGRASQEELRLLELIGYALPVDRLVAAAIERSARARYAKP